MNTQDAVIVSTARTPIGKAYRGAFNDTEAPVLGGHVIRHALQKAGVEGHEVDDVVLGIAAQQGNQGYNLGRLCCYTAGLPDSVGGMTIDRMCASGLMSIATAAKGIMTGEMNIAVAGGLESISLVQNKYKNSHRAQSKSVLEVMPTAYIQMIETAEIVSQRYGISREAQDAYSLQSQQRTANAQQAGLFEREIDVGLEIEGHYWRGDAPNKDATEPTRLASCWVFLIQGGTAPKAQTMGYSVGGKTGTAHKVEGKGYASKKYRGFFVGIAPIDNPRIVVAVMVDEPTNGAYFGGDVAAPVFSQTVQQTLRMMGVQPDMAVKPQVVTKVEKESF